MFIPLCYQSKEYEIKRKVKRAIKELLNNGDENKERRKREARLKNGGLIDHLDVRDYEDISYHNEYISDDMHTRIFVNYDEKNNHEDANNDDGKDSKYAKVLKCLNIFKSCKKSK
ncbi:hypothetical protein YYG_04047 [Plasmodium vinckei petteri]|uniref:Uncharacterized protein n=1 Tax=Plasmodium vinckei petteri TaxID=138298 RepID=W7AI38_PLAVN|nr:hypothetical protein YYG_04047 [Plasmodium vinckei petteri]